jgi:hypothetical protein
MILIEGSTLLCKIKEEGARDKAQVEQTYKVFECAAKIISFI